LCSKVMLIRAAYVCRRKSEAPAGDVTMEVDGEGDIEGETKEQKKARKEAKKQVSFRGLYEQSRPGKLIQSRILPRDLQAKALAKASGDLSTSTAVLPETPAANLTNGADEDKKDKKSKKRRASEVDGGAEANGDKEKKKKKKSKD